MSVRQYPQLCIFPILVQKSAYPLKLSDSKASIALSEKSRRFGEVVKNFVVPDPALWPSEDGDLVAVGSSSRARIWGECSTIHSTPAFFLFVFF